MTMPRSKRFSWSVLLLAGAVACAPVAAPGPQSTVPPMTMPIVQPAHPADVRFITDMIHHHSQALVVARLAPDLAGNPSIRTFAERVRVSQTDEIRLMQQWLQDVGEAVPLVDGAADHEHHREMPGMLTEAQLARLRSSRGADFDRLFLELMIQHHEGALEMVETLFATDGGGVDEFIYKIASDTFADQGSEIDRMQRMLDSMGAPR
jgi:uncharacterized protein (DUF305 family)